MSLQRIGLLLVISLLCCLAVVESVNLATTCVINSYVSNDDSESPRVSIKLTLNGAYNVTGTGTTTYVNHLLYLFKATNTSNGAGLGLTGITLSTGTDTTILTFTTQRHVCDIGPSITLSYDELPYQPYLFSINATRITSLSVVCLPQKMNTIYKGVLELSENRVVIKAARGIRRCADPTNFQLDSWWFTAIGGHTGPYRFCNTTSSPTLLPLDGDATMWWCYVNTTFATGQAATVSTFYSVQSGYICDARDNHTVTARNDADTTESFQLYYALTSTTSSVMPAYIYDDDGDGLYDHGRVTLNWNILAANFSIYKTRLLIANSEYLVNCTVRIASAVPQHVDYICPPFSIDRAYAFSAMLVGGDFFWNISAIGFSYQAGYGATTDFSTINSYSSVTLGQRDHIYYAWKVDDRCVGVAFRNLDIAYLGTDQFVVYDDAGVKTIVGTFQQDAWSQVICVSAIIDYSSHPVIYAFTQSIPGTSNNPLVRSKLVAINQTPLKGTGSCTLNDLDKSDKASYISGWVLFGAALLGIAGILLWMCISKRRRSLLLIE